MAVISERYIRWEIGASGYELLNGGDDAVTRLFRDLSKAFKNRNACNVLEDPVVASHKLRVSNRSLSRARLTLSLSHRFSEVLDPNSSVQ
jgi:hypothetical protein